VTRVAQLAVMMLRPPAALVIYLFAGIGVAAAGHGDEIHPLLTVIPVILAGWIIHAAAVNDLSDEAIDEVNLQNARGRPLVSGHASRSELLALGVAAAAVSLGTGFAVDTRVGLVIGGGLLLSVAYSVRPLRWADRGLVAPLLLPLGYVALPFLVGVFACGATLSLREVVLLGGLYVMFIGRIMLKDFRDVVGDEMFGKRTYLVRHGKQATCRISVACWVVGSAVVLLLFPWNSPIVAPSLVLLVCVLLGLRLLASAADPMTEQVVIGAVAQAGRGMAVLLLAALTMTDKGWTLPAQGAVMAAVLGVFVGLYAVALRDRGRVLELRPF
jgi:4-hydroxybenzoate polyprenyltransferase